jgi:hypothetical protein
MNQTRLPGRIGREIMHIACWGTGIISADQLAPTQILAERGYLTITNLHNGYYRIEPTERAKMTGATTDRRGWRRYPPLRQV